MGTIWTELNYKCFQNPISPLRSHFKTSADDDWMDDDRLTMRLSPGLLLEANFKKIKPQAKCWAMPEFA